MLRLASLAGLLLVLVPPAAAGPITVQARGEAPKAFAGARDIALQNAQRSAVEMALGTRIDSKTLTENMQLIQDRIVSVSAGYVAGYDVLSEGPSGDVYAVTIRATVKESIVDDTKAAIAAVPADPRQPPGSSSSTAGAGRGRTASPARARPPGPSRPPSRTS